LLFEEVKAGKFILVISSTTLGELENAPDYVQDVLVGLPRETVEFADFSPEVGFLRDAYIVAASVADVDLVVSWNFRHIVHYEKISGFQAINLINGYKEIRIYSPKEMIGNEEG